VKRLGVAFSKVDWTTIFDFVVKGNGRDLHGQVAAVVFTNHSHLTQCSN